MRTRTLSRSILPLLLAAGLGCASAGPVQISPDTYLISREDHGGIFGSLAKLKAAVIRQANEFAAKQGKIAIPISSHEKPLGNGPAQWASFEYQFRVVSRDDPEARRTSLTPRPDVVIESKQTISADVRTKDETEKPKDVYGDLIKLDDLRKRGVLTEAEFQAEKSKVLGTQSPSGGSRDVYSKLEQLDELRKKGILTDAEFEAEKKKLLNQ